MNKSYSCDSFLYGVVYYPEQWPESQWDFDLARIAETGMNVVRMGEGAWSVWEPEEGRYDFALFDRALELCEKHRLKAIMGTPTYTPPAWLTEYYPEVSRVSFQGTRLTHGSRRHYNERNAWRLEEAKRLGEEIKGVSACRTRLPVHGRGAVGSPSGQRHPLPGCHHQAR